MIYNPFFGHVSKLRKNWVNTSVNERELENSNIKTDR